MFASPFQSEAGAKCNSSSSAIISPALAAAIVLIAVNDEPSSVEYFHCPSAVSSVYEVIQTPANESLSAESANEAENRFVIVVDVDGELSSSIAVRDCVASATVGASLTAVTVISIVPTEADQSSPS